MSSGLVQIGTYICFYYLGKQPVFFFTDIVLLLLFERMVHFGNPANDNLLVYFNPNGKFFALHCRLLPVYTDS